jgi:predicted short-subunit dehydrogenase-like oxidoreductase (DUF2520 family)
MKSGVLGLVGAGAVGPALARRLRESGWGVGTVASRRLSSAEAAVELIGAGCPSDRNADALRGSDLLLIAVPDRAIGTVAAELAAEIPLPTGLLALHVSGALGSEVLAPLRDAGAKVGSLHPLQSFADARSALERLDETYLFFEGDDPERIRRVADDLGGRPVEIDSRGKVLYHAGAAAACNLGAAMIDLGLALFARAGIDRTEGAAALLPLLRGTLDNVERVGFPAALTGPVARGDLETVRAHLESLRSAAPDLLTPYAAGSAYAVRIALRKGSISEADAARLLDLLEAPDSY